MRSLFRPRSHAFALAVLLAAPTAGAQLVDSVSAVSAANAPAALVATPAGTGTVDVIPAPAIVVGASAAVGAPRDAAVGLRPAVEPAVAPASVAAVQRVRRRNLGRAAALMITGGALIVLGLVAGDDAGGALILGGAVVGGVGLYQYLR